MKKHQIRARCDTCEEDIDFVIGSKEELRDCCCPICGNDEDLIFHKKSTEWLR